MDNFAPLGSYIKGPEQVTPEQQQQQALIEALRNGMGAQQQAAPSQTGNVVNANANGSGYGQGAQMGGQIGGALNKADLGQYFGQRGAAADFTSGWTPANYG